MPCDGKNPNCQRRRELLEQLKCVITSMERKKPCEWNTKKAEQPVYCYLQPPERSCGVPLKCSKSYELRSSLMYKCECIRRNGLQDRCMIMDCMGRPECVTKLYPVCCPGQRTLIKLTDFGDEEKALRKYYNADKMRTNALEDYCTLKCQTVPASPSCPLPITPRCLPLCAPPCKMICPSPCPPPCPPPYKLTCPSPCPRKVKSFCKYLDPSSQAKQTCFPKPCNLQYLLPYPVPYLSPSPNVPSTKCVQLPPAPCSPVMEQFCNYLQNSSPSSKSVLSPD